MAFSSTSRPRLKSMRLDGRPTFFAICIFRLRPLDNWHPFVLAGINVSLIICSVFRRSSGETTISESGNDGEAVKRDIPRELLPRRGVEVIGELTWNSAVLKLYRNSTHEGALLEPEMHVESTCCKLNSVKQSNGTAADDCYSRVSKKVIQHAWQSRSLA